MAKTKKTSKTKERPVVVCTEFRGVFFGYAESTTGASIHLKRARNCIYWAKSIGGVLGLAEKGPNDECRIGARADVALRKVTCVMEVTEAARRAWESAACVS